jgi:hypothetical protein
MDIRLPLGLMFAVVGAVLVGFGAMTVSHPMYREHSLGVNLNVWAGLGILAFGLAMLWLARRGAARRPVD